MREMAQRLAVSRAAVHQHLRLLERDGLVKTARERRGVGRPSSRYTLTPLAEPLFPQSYGPLAVSLLRHLRATDGEKKIDLLFQKRNQELLALYRRELKGKPLRHALQALARIRDTEGYMAVTAEGPKGRPELVENHCPIAAIAKEFPQACLYELRLFEKALGRPLERTEHIASGARRCLYRLMLRKASP